MLTIWDERTWAITSNYELLDVVIMARNLSQGIDRSNFISNQQTELHHDELINHLQLLSQLIFKFIVCIIYKNYVMIVIVIT